MLTYPSSPLRPPIIRQCPITHKSPSPVHIRYYTVTHTLNLHTFLHAKTEKHTTIQPQREGGRTAACHLKQCVFWTKFKVLNDTMDYMSAICGMY